MKERDVTVAELINLKGMVNVLVALPKTSSTSFNLQNVRFKVVFMNSSSNISIVIQGVEKEIRDDLKSVIDTAVESSDRECSDGHNDWLK